MSIIFFGLCFIVTCMNLHMVLAPTFLLRSNVPLNLLAVTSVLNCYSILGSMQFLILCFCMFCFLFCYLLL